MEVAQQLTDSLAKIHSALESAISQDVTPVSTTGSNGGKGPNLRLITDEEHDKITRIVYKFAITNTAVLPKGVDGAQLQAKEALDILISRLNDDRAKIAAALPQHQRD